MVTVETSAGRLSQSGPGRRGRKRRAAVAAHNNGHDADATLPQGGGSGDDDDDDDDGDNDNFVGNTDGEIYTGDENEDDDDDDGLLDVRFTVGGATPGGTHTATIKEMAFPGKPPDDLEWDDDAILNCWNHSVASHDGGSGDAVWPMPSFRRKGQQPGSAKSDTENETAVADAATAAAAVLEEWQPKSLPLPAWAVDPFECAILLKERAEGSIERDGNGDDGE